MSNKATAQTKQGGVQRDHSHAVTCQSRGVARGSGPGSVVGVGENAGIDPRAGAARARSDRGSASVVRGSGRGACAVLPERVGLPYDVPLQC